MIAQWIENGLEVKGQLITHFLFRTECYGVALHPKTEKLVLIHIFWMDSEIALCDLIEE